MSLRSRLTESMTGSVHAAHSVDRDLFNQRFFVDEIVDCGNGALGGNGHGMLLLVESPTAVSKSSGAEYCIGTQCRREEAGDES